MTPPRKDTASAESAAFDERLNGLETTTKEGFKRLEAMLQTLEERLRAIETAAVTKIAVMDTRLGAAWKKIDEHEEKLKSYEAEQKRLTSAIEQLLGLRSFLIWGGSAFGILFVALLWAIITHQVEIVQVVK